MADSDHFSRNPTPQTLTLVVTRRDTVPATVPHGVFPREVAVSPDGRTAYVGDSGSRQLTVAPFA